MKSYDSEFACTTIGTGDLKSIVAPKFTPGPWRVGAEADSENRLVYIPITAGKKNISSTGVYGRRSNGTVAGQPYKDRFGIDRNKPVISEDEARANAKLIAAAPEMYEALKIARDNLQFLPPDDVVEQIDAALAKANGGAA